MQRLVLSDTTLPGHACKALCIGLILLFVNADAQTPTGSSTKIQVDTSTAIPIYANYARVTGTPDEVIIDFGVSANAADTAIQPIKIHYQVVMNFYTLKRLSTALQATVERHEAEFGPIELDVNKRTKK